MQIIKKIIRKDYEYQELDTNKRQNLARKLYGSL